MDAPPLPFASLVFGYEKEENDYAEEHGGEKMKREMKIYIYLPEYNKIRIKD